jgi:hypothetical protein
MGFWSRLVTTVKSAARWTADVTVVALRGQTLAVVGQGAVGKTRLLNFLLADRLEDASVYEQTTTEPFSRTRNRGNGHDVRLKRGTDLGGAEHVRDTHWKDACRDAGASFYLARADIILDESHPEHEAHARRIQEDISLISAWLKALHVGNGALPLDKRFVFVTTFCDRISGYREARATAATAITGPLYRSPLVRDQIDQVKPYVRHAAFVHGSTATRAEAERLKTELIKEGALGK